MVLQVVSVAIQYVSNGHTEIIAVLQNQTTMYYQRDQLHNYRSAQSYTALANSSLHWGTKLFLFWNILPIMLHHCIQV